MIIPAVLKKAVRVWRNRYYKNVKWKYMENNLKYAFDNPAFFEN